MYYIYGISGPSLLIESTDSMILCDQLCEKGPFVFAIIMQLIVIVCMDGVYNTRHCNNVLQVYPLYVGVYTLIQVYSLLHLQEANQPLFLIKIGGVSYYHERSLFLQQVTFHTEMYCRLVLGTMQCNPQEWGEYIEGFSASIMRLATHFIPASPLMQPLTIRSYFTRCGLAIANMLSLHYIRNSIISVAVTIG